MNRFKNPFSIAAIVMTVLLYGYVTTLATPQPAKPEEIVEAVLQAYARGDIDTCLKFVADDIVFRQEPPGTKMQGKIQFEAMLKGIITWHRQLSVTSPFNFNDDKITFSMKATGDDYRIVGLSHMAFDNELEIHDGKISSWLSMPNPENWKRYNELIAGDIGARFEVGGQGYKIRELAVNSPAYEAGIRVDDIIIAVNGVSCLQMTRAGEIQLRIKGPIESIVILTVVQKGRTTPINIEVTRVDLTKLRFQ